MGLLVNLVREAKEKGPKQRSLTKKETSALDQLLVNNSLLQSENSSLRGQISELSGYKQKYDKL